MLAALFILGVIAAVQTVFLIALYLRVDSHLRTRAARGSVRRGWAKEDIDRPSE